MKVSIILEKKNRQQAVFPIKISVGAGNGKRITFPTNCRCSEKNFVGKIGGEIVKRNTPNYSQINTIVNALYFDISTFALTHTLSELKEKYKPKKAKISTATLSEIASEHCKHIKPRTANLTLYSANLANEFNGKECDINDIDFQFVRKFNDFLTDKKISTNSIRLIHSRICALVNRAIDSELYHTPNPYRKFKAKKDITEPKPITATEMKRILTFDGKLTDKQQRALDLFRLSFYLCGLNLKDLYEIKKSNIVGGYIEIRRAKTNVPLRLFITPQANKIAEKYKSNTDDYWLNIAHFNSDYNLFLAKVSKMVVELNKLLKTERKITFYTARYTWATIADKIGTDEKVISKSLGHADVSMAGRHYIKYDWERTKQAAEKVAEYTINI